MATTNEYDSLVKLLREYTQVRHEDMQKDPKHLMDLAATAIEELQKNQASNFWSGRQDFVSTDVNR